MCNRGCARDVTVCVVTRVTSPTGAKHNRQHLLLCIHMKKIAKMVKKTFCNGLHKEILNEFRQKFLQTAEGVREKKPCKVILSKGKCNMNWPRMFFQNENIFRKLSTTTRVSLKFFWLLIGWQFLYENTQLQDTIMLQKRMFSCLKQFDSTESLFWRRFWCS